VGISGGVRVRVRVALSVSGLFYHSEAVDMPHLQPSMPKASRYIPP